MLKEQLQKIGITLLTGTGAINDFKDAITARKVTCVFLLADKNTFRAAGERVETFLTEAGITVKKYVFSEEKLEPNESAVGLAAMHFSPNVDMVVGVGSGVINDISKIIANISGKPYAIVATAPSMDGYASATSSMSVAGLKVSLPSKCADIIVGDTEILCAAPMDMMLSGLGDMLAKYVAICEWRLSALINGEPYDAEIADMVRTSLSACVANAEALLKREEDAVLSVLDGLILCGAAMKLAGCSRPASGVEHYLSHIWDMRGEEFGTPTAFHGIQCAVGTYIAAGIYEKIKATTPNSSSAKSYASNFDYSEWANTLKEFLGRGADAMIALEAKEGKYDVEKHAVRLERILANWDEILRIIMEEIPSLSKLSELYDTLGLPKTMEEIGLDSALLPLTFKASKDIRDKYVLSRLCFDLGIIDDVLGGYHEKTRTSGV